MTCKLPYKDSKRNSEKFLMDTGAMDRFHNILDLNTFRRVNTQLADSNLEVYGVQGRLWLEEDLRDSKKALPNEVVLNAIDQKRKELGIYENQIAGKKSKKKEVSPKKVSPSVNNTTQYQNLTEEPLVDYIASEKTIRDLAARISDRIGIPHTFISDRSQNFKGKLENNKAIINLAYATLDTPIHEILGHSIVRSIKNRKHLNGSIDKYNDVMVDFFDKNPNATREQAIQYTNKVVTIQPDLYQNLVKELETGIGKKVLDRIKKTYTTKSYVNNGVFYTHINGKSYTIVRDAGDTAKGEFLVQEDTSPTEKNQYGDNTYIGNYNFQDLSQFGLDLKMAVHEYTLEEQQEEAIVELLGLMTAKKLNDVRDGKLISLLKRLLKEMKEFIRSLLNQKEVEVDKLPDAMTINDLANLLAYSNSKLILPGYEVEYTTPDDRKFKTYQEASNHIGQLFNSDRNINLDNINVDLTPFSNEDVLELNYLQELSGEKIITKEQETRRVELINKSHSQLLGFIEKNREYEQSREIIEEWKKVNNIQYNPEEVYSRGQEFSSVVGAYSNFDVELMMQNLLQHIEDNEKAGGKFAISAYTKPIDKIIGHLEGGGGKIKFKIYPKSEDILWASNVDVYSGSVWDASEKINKDKKSELLGVSYTKYPALNNVNTVQPNLAAIIDNIAHHHNELGIVLTGNNFRLEYDEDIPHQTKKIIDNINAILDYRYGKLAKPNINKPVLQKVFAVFYQSEVMEDDGAFSHYEDVTMKRFDNEKDAQDFIDSDTRHYNYRIKSYNQERTLVGIQPKQTNETLKESIDGVKDKVTFFQRDISEIPNKFEGYSVRKETGEKLYQGTVENINGVWKINNQTISEEQVKKLYFQEKEYTSQALINTKIAALKEVSKKYPRTLIRSEVKSISVDSNDYGYPDAGDFFQLNSDTTLPTEITSDLKNQLLGFLQKIKPDFKVEVLDNLVETHGANGIAHIEQFLIQLQNGKEGALAEEASHFFVELLEKNDPLLLRMYDEVVNTRLYKKVINEYREVYKGDTAKLKREAMAKLIALKMQDEKLFNYWVGQDKSIIARISKWIGDFFTWLKGSTKPSSFIDAAREILDLNTSRLNIDNAIGKSQMFSLNLSMWNKFQSLNGTSFSNYDKVMINLNDTLIDYQGYKGTKQEKAKMIMNDSVARDEYYRTSKLTALGRELKDKIANELVSADKIVVYTNSFISPVLINRLVNELGLKEENIINTTSSEVFEDENGNPIDIETNNFEKTIFDAKERGEKVLVVDDKVLDTKKQATFQPYYGAKAKYVSPETFFEQKQREKNKKEVTDKLIEEINRLKEGNEKTLTQRLVEVFTIVNSQLKAIGRTEKILENMGAEEVDKIFKDAAGNVALPRNSASKVKKLVQEIGDFERAALEFVATLESTTAFFRERNNNSYQGIRDSIDPNDPDSIVRAIREIDLIIRMANRWQEYINQFTNFISDYPNIQEISKVLGQLDTEIKKTKNIGIKLSQQVIQDRLGPLFNTFNAIKDSQIAEKEKQKQDYISKGDTKAADRVQQVIDELTASKVNPENIGRALRGELDDLNPLTVWIKPLYDSSDLLVGGLDKLIKRMEVEVDTKFMSQAQAKGEEWENINKKHGLNAKDYEDIVVEEMVPVWNSETKEFEYKPGLALLNPWQNREDFDINKKPVDTAYNALNKGREEGLPKDELDNLYKTYHEAKATFESWKRENWHDQYTEEFYTRYEKLINSPEDREIFEKATELVGMLYEDINRISSLLEYETDEGTIEQLNHQIRDKKKDISFLKSERDPLGNMKVGDEAKIAKMLRDKSEIDKETFEYKSDLGRFKKDLKTLVTSIHPSFIAENVRTQLLFLLEDSDGNFSEFHKYAADEGVVEVLNWLDRFTVTKYSQDFYDQRKVITDKIADYIQQINTLSGEQNSDMNEIWEKVFAATSYLRDDDGILDGSVATEQTQKSVKQYEMQMEYLKEMAREDKVGTPEINEIKKKLNVEIEKLKNIQSRKVTEYYTESFVDKAIATGFKTLLDEKGIIVHYGSNLIEVINRPAFKKLMVDNPTHPFVQWVNDNHFYKSTWDQQVGDYVEVFYPTYIWFKVSPNDSTMVETVPSYKYSKREVREKFKTVKEDWKTWNPIEFKWLPKSQKYFNPKYRDLMNRTDSKGVGLQALLKSMTDYYLGVQEDAPKEARRSFLLPTVEKKELEGNVIKSMYNQFIDKTNRYEQGEGNFGENQDDSGWQQTKAKLSGWFSGLLGTPKVKANKKDRRQEVAVPYTTYMDPKDQSTDLPMVLTMFAGTTSRAKEYVKILPLIRVIKENISDQSTKYDSEGNEKQSNDKRLEAVEFIEQNRIFGKNKEYELGIMADRILTQVRKINTFGSLSIFTGTFNNIKNNLQGRLQNLINSQVADWASPSTMRKAMLNMESNLFKYLANSNKPLAERSVDYFITTFFLPKVTNEFKTMLLAGADKRVIQNQFQYFQSALSEFGISTTSLYAHLYHVKVEKEGVTKTLYEILNKEGNTLGVEEGWKVQGKGINVDMNYLYETATTFMSVQGYMQGKGFDKIKASTFTIGQSALYFKNWLIPMLRRRFDTSKEANYMTNELMEGYWITFGRLSYRMIKDFLQEKRTFWHTYTEEEKRNYMATIREIAVMFATLMILSLVFGFDADDPDKFKKLKHNSYATNLALLIVLQAKNETESLSAMPFLNIEQGAVPPVLTEGVKFVKNPLIGLSIIDDTWKLVNSTYDLAMDSPGAIYDKAVPQYHIEKGDTKAGHYLKRVTQFDDLTNQTKADFPATKIQAVIGMMKR